MTKKSGFIASFLNAFRGIKSGISGHRNIKIMLLLAIAAIATAFYLQIENNHWIALLICISTVISLEFINTSIENILDHLHPSHHEKVGMAKDIAAAAVLISSVISAIIGAIIFSKYLFS